MKTCPHCGIEYRDGDNHVCQNQQSTTNPVDLELVRKEAGDKARGEFRKRHDDIMSIAEKHNATSLGIEFLRGEGSVEDFIKVLLERKYQAKPIDGSDVTLGLSEKEKKDFSFVRLMNALTLGKRDLAPYEFDISDAHAKKVGKESKGAWIPDEILRHENPDIRKEMLSRVLTVATAGASIKGTDLLSGSFIDMLRNAMVVRGMGARVLSGLVGDIAIPRQTGGATAYWLPEDTDITSASTQTFDQVTLSPKNLGAYSEIARNLLLQSSIDIEALVREDLAVTLALAIDNASINGTGASNQPEGIRNVTGIGSVVGGTNGLAPTFAHFVDLETEVSQDNALLGSLGYMVNMKTVGYCKKTEAFSSTGRTIWEQGNTINGYMVGRSNQVPSNLTKGTSSGICSSIIFGNFRDLLIGQWGGLDVLVDPYTGSIKGRVRVVVFQSVDVAVRHPESFATMEDALT